MADSKKVSRTTRKKVEKLANAYNTYVTRLNERETLTQKEKQDLLDQFFEANKDQINEVIIAAGHHEDYEADMEKKGFNRISIEFLNAVYWRTSNYANWAEVNQGNAAGDNMNDLKKTLAKKTTLGSYDNEEDRDDLHLEDDSPQAKGLREIAAWMYRNSEVTTLANRQKGKTGKESKMVFIEAVLAKSQKEKLLTYYLVEKWGTRKGKKLAGSWTMEDVIASQTTYTPNLAKFKDAMLANGLKRFFGREYVKWDLLGNAVQTAVSAIGATSSVIPGEGPDFEYTYHDDILDALSEEGAAINEKAKKEKEAAKKSKKKSKKKSDVESEIDDIQPDELFFDDEEDELLREAENEGVLPEDPKSKIRRYDKDEEWLDDLKLIPSITKRIRALIDKNPEASKESDLNKVAITDELDQQEFEKLKLALVAIQSHINDYVTKRANYDPDAAFRKTDNIEAKDTAIFKKLGDGLQKLPIPITMAAGSALGLAAILIKVGGLIKNGSKLNAADKWMRVSELFAACADFANQFAKMGAVTTAFMTATTATGNVGMGLLAGKTVLDSVAMNTVSGAFGVASGGLMMASAAVEAGRAGQIKKSRKKTDEYLGKASAGINQYPIKDQDSASKPKLEMANNIRAFMDSAYHGRVFKASTKMIAGSITALGGALTLSGIGAAVGIPLMVVGLVATIAQKIGSKIQAKKETKETVDRFLKLDEIMSDAMFGPINDNKDLKTAVRNELRQYALAQMGAASINQGYNIIMSKYAAFLYEQLFIADEGRYIKKEEFDALNPNDPDNNIRFACLEMVKALGVKPKFSADGKADPKTKPTDIRRRMIV